jgi:hypothetical protein
VNLSKLARRLRREAVGSPKKAAVLALLAVVALYYWMPLVWGWIGKANGSGTAAVAAATPPAAATNTPPAQPAATSPTAAKPAGAAMTWQETLRAIEADPRTVPAALLGGRDPFVEEKPAVVAANMPQRTAQRRRRPPLCNARPRSCQSSCRPRSIIGCRGRFVQPCLGAAGRLSPPP